MQAVDWWLFPSILLASIVRAPGLALSELLSWLSSNMSPSEWSNLRLRFMSVSGTTLHIPAPKEMIIVLPQTDTGIFKVWEPWEGTVTYAIITFVLNMTFTKWAMQNSQVSAGSYWGLFSLRAENSCTPFCPFVSDFNCHLKLSLKIICVPMFKHPCRAIWHSTICFVGFNSPALTWPRL